jgi:type IV pilus assembly protein PilO
MPELTDTRQKLKIAIAALALVDVVAVVVLLSPLVGSATSRRQQLDQLWQELRQKTQQVEPLRGMDKKVVVARGQIEGFYKDRLPDRDSIISADLGRLAAQSGVQIGQIKYKAKDPESVGLRPVQIEADFSGDYLQLVRFINALERDQLFFLIDSVQLVGEQQGSVKLQLKLETYLKTGA